MNNAKRKITITDKSQAIESGITTSVTPDQIKEFLRDPSIEVTISNIGLFSIGWKDKRGTPETYTVPAHPAMPPSTPTTKPITVKEPELPLTPSPITPQTKKINKDVTHDDIPNFNA
jgi:hypothetical protein